MKNQWVIADIHGCYETLIRLIEDQIRPGKSDQIYFLGDYIDRGPNSKAVLDYIIYLKELGYQISALKGNHEDVFLRCYAHESSSASHVGLFELKESWLYFGGKATLKSFGVKNLIDVPDYYINFLSQLPNYQVLPQHILVHAGLNFTIDDPFSDQLSMYWIKDFKVVPHKINHRKVVHGHVPSTLTQIQKNIHKELSFSLDNGCVYHNHQGMGNLIALELNSMQLAVQKNVDLNKKPQRTIRLVA